MAEQENPHAKGAASEPASIETPPAGMVQGDTAVVQPSPPQAERRVAPRYIAHWRAALVSLNDGAVRYLGTTDNLCLSGTAISCDSHVPPQKDYHIYLEIPQSVGKAPIVIQLQGRVVHTTLSRKVFRVGMTFKQFHGEAEQILRAILSSGKLKQLVVEQ